MNQFLKNHKLNKAEFGVTDESISVWISGSQDKNPSTTVNVAYIGNKGTISSYQWDKLSSMSWKIKTF